MNWGVYFISFPVSCTVFRSTTKVWFFFRLLTTISPIHRRYLSPLYTLKTLVIFRHVVSFLHYILNLTIRVETVGSAPGHKICSQLHELHPAHCAARLPLYAIQMNHFQ